MESKRNNMSLDIAASAMHARDRIKPYIYLTPLIPSRTTGHDHGSKVWFKAENFQKTGSFKIRGALSRLSFQTAKPLITASSGNHGIGCALAAHILQKDLKIVLPTTVVAEKLSKIRAYGTDVILHGSDSGVAEKHAQELASRGDYIYLSPYNNRDIIAGQGTIGLELIEQIGQAKDLDNVFIAMGGGGLISGIGAVLKASWPHVKIWGVSATNSNALAQSMKAHRVVETEHKPTLAEAVAGGLDEDTVTLPLALEVVDKVVECDEAEIKSALRFMAFDEKMLVEGAAALALAGYLKEAKNLKGESTVIVLCGANFAQEAIMDAMLNS